jgi:hypothetical protein
MNIAQALHRSSINTDSEHPHSLTCTHTLRTIPQSDQMVCVCAVLSGRRAGHVLLPPPLLLTVTCAMHSISPCYPAALPLACALQPKPLRQRTLQGCPTGRLSESSRWPSCHCASLHSSREEGTQPTCCSLSPCRSTTTCTSSLLFSACTSHARTMRCGVGCSPRGTHSLALWLALSLSTDTVSAVVSCGPLAASVHGHVPCGCVNQRDKGDADPFFLPSNTDERLAHFCHVLA